MLERMYQSTRVVVRSSPMALERTTSFLRCLSLRSKLCQRSCEQSMAQRRPAGTVAHISLILKELRAANRSSHQCSREATARALNFRSGARSTLGDE